MNVVVTILCGVAMSLLLIAVLRATQLRACAVSLGSVLSLLLAVPAALLAVSLLIGNEPCSDIGCGLRFYYTVVTWFLLAIGVAAATFTAQMVYTGRE